MDKYEKSSENARKKIEGIILLIRTAIVSMYSFHSF